MQNDRRTASHVHWRYNAKTPVRPARKAGINKHASTPKASETNSHKQSQRRHRLAWAHHGRPRVDAQVSEVARERPRAAPSSGSPWAAATLLAAGPRARRARAQCVSRSSGSRCRHCTLRRTVQAQTLAVTDNETGQKHGPQAARAARARGRVAAVHGSPCSAKVAARVHKRTKVGKRVVARGGSSARAWPWPPLRCAQMSAGVDSCGPVCALEPPPQRVHPPRPSALRSTFRSASPAAPGPQAACRTHGLNTEPPLRIGRWASTATRSSEKDSACGARVR